ncbi:MAG: Rne/Rng family ribonuclease [Rhodobacteraceae bacterium]|nr:MAG: Rne/Rng family ribonuclease [Paracoccaceae bacterium]
MAQKMLIDATHAEETRVVVVDGTKVEEFDFETASRRQLAGNIYLAKVTRVEPSLQAAFVDYGGNRHGFLAFNEIHPDYYQIPAADRAELLAEERALSAEAEAEEHSDDKKDEGAGRSSKGGKRVRRSSSRRKPVAKAARSDAEDEVETREIEGMAIVELDGDDTESQVVEGFGGGDEAPVAEATAETEAQSDTKSDAEPASGSAGDEAPEQDVEEGSETPYRAADHATEIDDRIEAVSDGGDPVEEERPRRKPRMRRYKIQEVIKVRQIMLVQVVKEERGNKGAALTTYLSLAGRYCVLMPNTARGGGISRKITNASDRQKLKAIANEIKVPEGAGLIIRTAGANRTKAEIKRDYEYLLRLWEQIRDLTLKSIAPTPIYEEGDLIKRSIRDLYNKNIDEVLVEGESGYRVAKDFMKMIMPSHAKNVKLYSDPLPLFARYQVESYLAAMFNPTVQLPSGGYIVIGITEALVAIDINSGRATREGSIEETALKTNLEAAAEIARQLRLRDLAGLIVIDFIDMEERKNNAAVEKMLKDKLKNDRARIQVGRISGFGLMEMSRQRLRPGMLEATTQPCPHCHGTGLIRSADSMGLTVLRQIEEEGTRGRTREVLLRAPTEVVNFIFNQKREHLAQIEARYGMAVRLEADPRMVSPDFEIEKFKTATRVATPQSSVVSINAALMPDLEEEEPEQQSPTSTDEGAAAATEDEDQPRKKRRRRRRRRGGQENAQDQDQAAEAASEAEDAGPAAADATQSAPEAEQEATVADAEPAAKPRRPRRGRGKKAAETAPAETGSDAAGEAVAEAAPEVTPSTPESGEADAPAPAAKPKRTRRKPAKSAKAAPDGKASAETNAEVATGSGEAEAPVSETAPSAPADEPAPMAAADAPEAAVQPVLAEAAPTDAPAAGDAVQSSAMADTDAASTSETDTAAVTDETGAAEEPAAEIPARAQKKRRGWWALRG